MILKTVDDDRQTCLIVTRIDRRKDLSCSHHTWADDGDASFVD